MSGRCDSAPFCALRVKVKNLTIPPARSVDRIFQQEITITRKSVTTPDDAAAQIKKDGNLTGTMGRKSIVPYGLYVAHGFVSAHEAVGIGVGDDDLTLIWDALKGMFDHDRYAARGPMVPPQADRVQTPKRARATRPLTTSSQLSP